MRLFDETKNDDNIKIFRGESTNLLNLNTTKYKWAKSIFDVLFTNNWHPDKVPLGDDKLQYKTLTDDEREAYDTVLSFLIFLDSIQTNNLPNIAEHITAPEVTMVLARQTYDEALHSLSYGHIGESMFTVEDFKDLAYKWRGGGVLLDRIRNITEGYEEFINNPTDEEFVYICVKNFLLEGLYFYNGFYLFHNLASRGLMVGTDTIIRWIQRDEIQHCNLFKNIINELRIENPDLFKKCEKRIYELFQEAVDLEIQFSSETIGNKILGMTTESIREYSYHLGNRRLKEIKMDQIFPRSKNPYKHLDLIAGVEDETSVRSNNFEVTSINYKTSTILEGWEDL